MPYDFFRYLTAPPSSERALFNNIKRCYSALAPKRLKKLKPSSEYEIKKLEEVFQSRFGKPLPSCFKMYLQQMGKDYDGLGLLSCMLYPDWSDFADGDLARDTRKRFEQSKTLGYRFGEPPYWSIYHPMISQTELGFSPVTDDPNQLITHDNGFCYTNDTLPKLLTFLTCLHAIQFSEEMYGKSREYKESRIPSNSQDIYSIEFFAECPLEWTPIGHTLLVNFLNRLESQFTLKECWFSINKEFDLFDINHKPVISESPLLTRYVSIQETSNLMFSVRFHPQYIGRSQIQVNLYGNNTDCIKQIMSEILQQTKLTEISMVIIQNS